ncbi:MAG: hypothetical protein CVU66_00740 [Deltaproteobacteria bacterium HGW-Deltaproteobacteria-23]|nr:MAG: hypothetical protein CVU66_00740 [Deltaproteobacteria bacterium HGW-Deltaproteobacteria-23]
MSILTVNNFTGEYLVPNLTGLGPAVTGNLSELTGFITKYEPEYLKQVLGATLYAVLMTGLKSESVDERWVELAKKLDGSETQSPITGYVYYHWARNRVTVTGALGELEPTAENAAVVVGEKMMRAYNDSVRGGRLVYDWLIEHQADYPEFDPYTAYSLETINMFGL